jgi:hypothetical protein
MLNCYYAHANQDDGLQVNDTFAYNLFRLLFDDEIDSDAEVQMNATSSDINKDLSIFGKLSVSCLTEDNACALVHCELWQLAGTMFCMHQCLGLRAEAMLLAFEQRR